jgi:hypothetical protein
MTLRLSDDDLSFYLAAAKRLPAQDRPLFHERVVAILEPYSDPGPGTVNAAVRQALAEWQSVPQRPAVMGSRWSR